MADLRIDSVCVKWTEELDGLACQAVAEVSYQINDKSRDRRLEWLTSGGLHAIELAGPDDPYKREIELEELADLYEHLTAFGIDANQWKDWSLNGGNHD